MRPLSWLVRIRSDFGVFPRIHLLSVCCNTALYTVGTVLWWFSFVGTVHHVLTAVLLYFSTRSTVRPVWIILVYMWFQLYAAGSIIIRGTARSRAFVCFFIYSFWWWPYRIYGTIQTCQSFLRVSSSVQTGCGRLQHDVWLPASVP